MHKRAVTGLMSLLMCIAAWPSGAQPVFSNAVSLGTISNAVLTETSGLAVSPHNPGVLWTHNDVGDTNRIYALSAQGKLLGSYTLSNATHVDYEDIATGPGPVTNVQYLYVGDVGDNKSVRSTIAVYQLPEPAVYLRQVTNPVTFNLKGVRKISFQYPDGAHNAETLLVDPLSGDIFIATRQTNGCRIYSATRAQMDAGGTNTLTFVRQISFDAASGGAISPTGGEIVIRSPDLARLWTRAPGQSVSDALAGTARPIPVVGRTNEPFGEGISFDSTGRNYFTVSDSTLVQPLYYFERVSPFAFRAPRVLIGAGAEWRYLDTGTNPAPAWRTNGFDERAWKSGEGQFGYGEGDEQTVVSYGPNASSKFITTWFRKSFLATNLASLGRLELKLLFDDGAAVFLNGTQIALVNLTNGAAFNSFATNSQENFENIWFVFNVNPALLVEGPNVLAVEIHQVSANSDDLSFDVQLLAHENVPSQIVSRVRQTNGAWAMTFISPTTNVTVEASTNLLAWTDLGSTPVTNGSGAFVDLTATNHSRRFYRLRQ